MLGHLNGKLSKDIQYDRRLTTKMEQLIAANADNASTDVDINNFMAEVVEKSATIPVVVQFWRYGVGRKQLGPVLEKLLELPKVRYGWFG